MGSEQPSESGGPGRAGKPGVYLLVLVLTLGIAFGYKVATDSIFACPIDGYSADDYLSYCNTAYGDYDHGAFWFGLEPVARRNAAAADVLFIGSSRLQLGFSSRITRDWFEDSEATHFLLGFTHEGNVRFFEPLLREINPRPRVLVVNVDSFFEAVESQPVAEVLHDDAAARRYARKRQLQPLHQAICSRFRALCRGAGATYRSRQNGHWTRYGASESRRVAVADGPARNQDRWDDYARLADAFVSKLDVDRDCIVLTIVPSATTKRDEATAIADALELDLIAPRVDGLTTSDGSHLDGPSGERWSAAFFDAAGPRIRQCLAGS